MLDRLEQLARNASRHNMLSAEYIDGGGPWPVLSGGNKQTDTSDDSNEQAWRDSDFVEAANPDMVLRLIAIVRDLAANGPLLDWREPSLCQLCEADGYLDEIEEHKPECPWRRAVELTKEQP